MIYIELTKTFLLNKLVWEVYTGAVFFHSGPKLSKNSLSTWDYIFGLNWSESFKGTVMQIEKSLINDRLRVSKLWWNFRTPTI